MIDPSKPFCSCKFRRLNALRDFWKFFEVRYTVHLLQIASECIGGGELPPMHMIGAPRIVPIILTP